MVNQRHTAGVLASTTLLLALTTTGGCTMTRSGDTPSGSTTSVVHDGTASFDLRTRLTRSDVGMGTDGFVTYPRGSSQDSIETTVRLPRGTVRASFFRIDAGTNSAFAADTDNDHAPKYFDFYQRAKDLDAARAMLRRDATALGLTDAEIADVSGEGTSVELGFVDDWLSSYVQVRAAVDGGLNVIYSFAIDSYHNEAVDKILHDGVVTLDLTRRPSREDLGFLPGYDDATVQPAPGALLTVRVRTAAGVTDLPATSLISDGTHGRADDTVSLGLFEDLAAARSALRAAAPVLGFDFGQALAFVDEPAGDVRYRELSCADGAAYRCALRLSTTSATGGGTSVGYRLTLTYR